MADDAANAARGGSLSTLARQEENNAPMLAIFGGVFALLLVFLLLVNVHTSEAVRERIDRASEHGTYRIERMDGGSGYVVIVFPGELRVVETGMNTPADEACDVGSDYRTYAERIYGEGRDQLVFFLLEGSIGTMYKARDCLRRMWPDRLLTIGWVVADDELLKSISLDNIPPYIRDYVEQQP